MVFFWRALEEFWVLIQVHFFSCPPLRVSWGFQFLLRKEKGGNMSSSAVFSGDEIAPFFGFIGAAAALVFSCKCALITMLFCF